RRGNRGVVTLLAFHRVSEGLALSNTCSISYGYGHHDARTDAGSAGRRAGLGEAVSLLARIESRAAALRWEVSAEADRRRVAEQTGETGTDAWLARLTVSTREQAAGGLWLA